MAPRSSSTRPSDERHGDYATNVALRLAGTLRRPPREVAEELRERVAGLDGVAGVEVAGPGFLNLTVDDGWLAGGLAAVLEAGGGFGGGVADEPERIQVELVSANPTGPITVASARNGAYGDAVARLLAFAGHTVEREYYYNDAGAQMDLFRASVEAVRRGEEPPEDGYRGDYLAELARVEGDPVPRMLEEIEASLERFRIHFDSFERQSVVESEVPEAIALLDTYEEDGAVWARTSAHGDDKDRVVVRSNGEPTYFAFDAAYIRRKYARGFDRLIYVLGADHHGYVARLQALAEMLGHPRESVEVLIYQLVNLTRGGEAARMSKRRGDVVFLDEFLDEIGVDAARWYLLSRGHDQTIEIDVDLAAERSQKNPVYYVQYAHARIAGVLRNAEGRRARRVAGGVARAARSASSSSGCSSCPTSSVRPPHGARRTRSRRTRSASRTTSTASTTSTRCSAPTRRPSGSRSARRRRPSSRRASTCSGSRRPSACSATGAPRMEAHLRSRQGSSDRASGRLQGSAPPTGRGSSGRIRFCGFLLRETRHRALEPRARCARRVVGLHRRARGLGRPRRRGARVLAARPRRRHARPRRAGDAAARPARTARPPRRARAPWASCRAPTGCSSSRPSSTARSRSPC